jgi:uncharacterized protein (TIGR03435 family)
MSKKEAVHLTALATKANCTVRTGPVLPISYLSSKSLCPYDSNPFIVLMKMVEKGPRAKARIRAQSGQADLKWRSMTLTRRPLESGVIGITKGSRIIRNAQKIGILLVLLASVLFAQPLGKSEAGDAAKLPAFEVASVKPTDLNREILVGVFVYPGGRIRITGYVLTGLIRTAYQLTYQQVAGGADWTDQTLYDLEAVPPKDVQASIQDLRFGPSKISDERLRQMLQTLLRDRFQLKFHWETKTGTVHLLTRGAKPSAFRASDAALTLAGRQQPIFWRGRRQWVMKDATMADLAEYASAIVHGPVRDRTELRGRFNYTQSPIEPDPVVAGADISAEVAASFLKFLDEIHLKLERARGQVETFVIDHAERPSPN